MGLAVFSNAATLPCVVAGILSLVSQSHADTPPGWISSTITSAYTLGSLEVDLSAAALAVNETIDIFNFRDDLLAGNSRLADDSGDLSGYRGEVQFGLGSMFTLFYREQNHDLTVKLAEQSQLDLDDLDTELRTTARAYGVKWNFFESGHSNDETPWHAASIELTRTESKTDDFQAHINRIQLNSSTSVTFNPAQAFQIDELEDEGWLLRLIYTLPLTDSLVTSFWGGYGSFEASAGTSSDIANNAIRNAFQQSFLTEENQVLLGLSMNWQITPRMPLQLTYEYINVRDRELDVQQNPLSSILPSFLRASNLSDVDDNHTLSGSLSYWLTPRLNLGLQARLFSHQFVGVMPHYNNPLSGRFADTAYGYAGIQLGYRL